MKTQSTPNPYNICTFATISTNIRRRPVAINLTYEPSVQEVQDQIGDLYLIPKAVRDEGAFLASVGGYFWPQALQLLADNVVVRVNRLWKDDGDDTLMLELRVDDMQARQNARGQSRMDDEAAFILGPANRFYQNIQQPLCIIMEYNEFIHMKRRVMIAGVTRLQDVDLFERYWIANDHSPALDEETD